jgi:cell division protease FtsH
MDGRHSPPEWSGRRPLLHWSGPRDQGPHPGGHGREHRRHARWSCRCEGKRDDYAGTIEGTFTTKVRYPPSDTKATPTTLFSTQVPSFWNDAAFAALLQDKKVEVDARVQILRVHTRSLPLADDVDLDALAATTPGMVGADLANLANEAALLAARRGHETVAMADFTDSPEKILVGAPRGILVNREDRERTAYHESGHALVGMLTPDAYPVRKVSIIPCGQALGVTLSTPDSDRVSYSREELEAKIKVSLGGRVAEEVVYGRITTGAESDLEQLTQIAREMVGRWGMSEKLGPITWLPSDGQGPLLPGASDTSQQTHWLVDQEVHRMVDDAHAEVTQLLTTHRAELDSLAHALLEAETLDAPDAYAAAGIGMRTGELEAAT